jgi:hypothetical protein
MDYRQDWARKEENHLTFKPAFYLTTLILSLNVGVKMDDGL